MSMYAIQSQVKTFSNGNVHQRSLNLSPPHAMKRVSRARLENTEGTIGGRILRRLAALGKNQTWLSMELGVSDTAVSKWITHSNPSRSNLLRTAMVLGVSAGWLFSGEEAGLPAMTKRVSLAKETEQSKLIEKQHVKPESAGSQEMLLLHITQDEAALLSLVREATPTGKILIYCAAETARKQLMPQSLARKN